MINNDFSQPLAIFIEALIYINGKVLLKKDNSPHVLEENMKFCNSMDDLV